MLDWCVPIGKKTSNKCYCLEIHSTITDTAVLRDVFQLPGIPKRVRRRLLPVLAQKTLGISAQIPVYLKFDQVCVLKENCKGAVRQSQGHQQNEILGDRCSRSGFSKVVVWPILFYQDGSTKDFSQLAWHLIQAKWVIELVQCGLGLLPWLPRHMPFMWPPIFHPKHIMGRRHLYIEVLNLPSTKGFDSGYTWEPLCVKVNCGTPGLSIEHP